MKKLFLLISFLLLTACQPTADPTDNTTGSGNAGLANPASVYCNEQGGKLEIRDNELGQYGVCVFSDGSECEEWAYFRGDCKPGRGQGGAGINSFDDCVAAGNPVMESYPRQCMSADGQNFTEVLDKPVGFPADDAPTICTMDYTPVCALVQVQCVKAPCPPVFETKSNECVAKTLGNMLLGYTPGECEKDLETACKSDSDCLLGDYAAISRCPFDAKCVSGQCVVVCPQSHASGSSAM